jgi:hypothetical protein
VKKMTTWKGVKWNTTTKQVMHTMMMMMPRELAELTTMYARYAMAACSTQRETRYKRSHGEQWAQTSVTVCVLLLCGMDSDCVHLVLLLACHENGPVSCQKSDRFFGGNFPAVLSKGHPHGKVSSE